MTWYTFLQLVINDNTLQGIMPVRVPSLLHPALWLIFIEDEETDSEIITEKAVTLITI